MDVWLRSDCGGIKGAFDFQSGWCIRNRRAYNCLWMLCNVVAGVVVAVVVIGLSVPVWNEFNLSVAFFGLANRTESLHCLGDTTQWTEERTKLNSSNKFHF